MSADLRPRVLADFAGQWTLRKTIAQADGLMGDFQGTATWSIDDQGAMYHEVGSLRLGQAAALSAMRSYRWTADLDVFFEDGRFFHSVPPTGGGTNHWCDPDRYDVEYDFSQWPAFKVEWRVTGPRKDYTMTCLYRRE